MKGGPQRTHCGKVSLGDRQCVCMCVCVGEGGGICMYKLVCEAEKKFCKEHFVVRLKSLKTHTYCAPMCGFLQLCACA